MTARSADGPAWRSVTIAIAAATAMMSALTANPTAAQAAPPTTNQIEMELKISGTGGNGFELEIRPGHRACSFQTIKKTIDPGREQMTIKIDRFVAESISPDRDCCFEIVIREPGQADRAIKRGVRLDKPKIIPGPDGQESETVVPVQQLTYYLASPAFSVIDKKSRIR